MLALTTDVFAFIKPSLDAHTLGVNSVTELLRECGYRVLIANDEVARAINRLQYESNRLVVLDWLVANTINRVGISYRLDQDEAVRLVGRLVYALESNNLLHYQGGPIKAVYFAGLPGACDAIEVEHRGLVVTFRGGESAYETLTKLGVPAASIPRDILEAGSYDDCLMKFGKDIINSQGYQEQLPVDRSGYPDFGTSRDSITKRLKHNLRTPFVPLVRAHVGPYSSSQRREESVREFILWVRELAQAGFLDVLSIGTSQLTQSNFGEDWGDKPNGGGVPINSPEEYRAVWEASRPLLVRTYAGTKNTPQLAEMYEETLNIAWHALSLWWFNRLDGRGPNDLYTNLCQHVETLKYIAKTGKPFEPNVPHHFAFRGADDVTYIVSAYLSAKLAKRMGIRTLILQNMLNTPRYTWGVQDLAKSRAMLALVRDLESSDFQVLLQPRAGLDYFRPDTEEAKAQLAAVTALMDDIEPHDETSPPLIHVVSYSEASHLATPAIVNESIKITLHSLMKYRKLRREGNVDDMATNRDVEERKHDLLEPARKVIAAIESSIADPYTPKGLYTVFAAGFLPTPYLWGEWPEFEHAKKWKTKPIRGSVRVVDDHGNAVDIEDIVNYARTNVRQVEASLERRLVSSDPLLMRK